MRSGPFFILALGIVLSACAGGVSNGKTDSGVGATDSGTDAGKDAGTEPVPDAGTVTPSACAGHSYKLCEDFEAPVGGGLPAGWTVKAGFADHPAPPTVVTDAAHTGTHSLKSVSAETLQARIGKSLSSLGPTPGTHWGRIFYKLGAPLPTTAGGYFHMSFVGLDGPADESRVIDTLRANDTGHFQFSYYLKNGSCCEGSGYTFDFDVQSWHCVEWYVDAAHQAFRFFYDGTEVASLAFTGQASASESQYTAVYLGPYIYKVPDAPVTVWMDDLAMNDSRIGCGP